MAPGCGAATAWLRGARCRTGGDGRSWANHCSAASIAPGGACFVGGPLLGCNLRAAEPAVRPGLWVDRCSAITGAPPEPAAHPVCGATTARLCAARRRNWRRHPGPGPTTARLRSPCRRTAGEARVAARPLLSRDQRAAETGGGTRFLSQPLLTRAHPAADLMRPAALLLIPPQPRSPRAGRHPALAPVTSLATTSAGKPRGCTKPSCSRSADPAVSQPEPMFGCVAAPPRRGPVTVAACPDAIDPAEAVPVPPSDRTPAPSAAGPAASPVPTETGWCALCPARRPPRPIAVPGATTRSAQASRISSSGPRTRPAASRIAGIGTGRAGRPGPGGGRTGAGEIVTAKGLPCAEPGAAGPRRG